jgi:hypothetical protein
VMVYPQIAHLKWVQDGSISPFLNLWETDRILLLPWLYAFFNLMLHHSQPGSSQNVHSTSFHLCMYEIAKIILDFSCSDKRKGNLRIRGSSLMKLYILSRLGSGINGNNFTGRRHND